jgi:hypothetical protein
VSPLRCSSSHNNFPPLTNAPTRARWVASRAHLHPELARIETDAVHVVDRFHFVKNHIGRWCDAYSNPLKVRALDKVGQRTLGLTICEGAPTVDPNTCLRALRRSSLPSTVSTQRCASSASATSTASAS